MPGFNRRGPEGQGAMTGRQMGFCRNRDAGPAAAAYGFGGGRGGRGNQGGRGRCRSAGFGWGPGAVPETRESLQARARMLEDELAAVKEQLNDEPDTK